jgi:hypothetical protein
VLKQLANIKSTIRISADNLGTSSFYTLSQASGAKRIKLHTLWVALLLIVYIGLGADLMLAAGAGSPASEGEEGLSQKPIEIARVFGFPITNSMVATWIVDSTAPTGQEVVPAEQQGGSDAHRQLLSSNELHEQKHATLGINTVATWRIRVSWLLKRMVMGMLATYTRNTVLCVQEIGCPACSV